MSDCRFGVSPVNYPDPVILDGILFQTTEVHMQLPMPDFGTRSMRYLLMVTGFTLVIYSWRPALKKKVK